MPRGMKIFAYMLILGIFASAIYGVWIWKTWKPRARPDIQMVGGTILVYEAATPEDIGEQTLKLLVNRLELRLRYANLSKVTVKPIDRRSVAFEVPGSDNHSRVLMRVRNVVRRGKARFRIVANENDDHEIFRECGRLFDDAKSNSELWDDLAARARKGLPPPLPNLPKGQKAWQTRHKELGEATYNWVRLSRSETKYSGLVALPNQTDGQESRQKKAIEGISKGEPVILNDMGGWMLYGRACIDESLTQAQRDNKRIEFFLLIRDSETDPSGENLLTVDGVDLIDANAYLSALNDPCITVAFSEPAGERLYKLTHANTRREPARSLAFILDEIVYSCSRLSEPKQSHVEFYDDFSNLEVEAFVAVLKSGELPVRLMPNPDRSETVAKK